MRKIYVASAVYLALGLIAGVFYREFTRAMDAFGSQTQLNTLHTHLLTLGMMFFLIVLGLETIFGLTEDRQFMMWFVLHNVALAWTIGFMLANGIVHVSGNGDAWGPMWSGIAGVGHILLAAAFILFFSIVYRRIKVYQRRQRRVERSAAQT